MKWFTNLKIRSKLIICFVILAVFTGVVGAVGINSMNDMNTRSQDMYNNNFLPAQKLAKAQVALEGIRSNHLLLLYERNTEMFQERMNQIDRLALEDTEMLQAYGQTILLEEEKALYNTLMTDLAAYRTLRSENIALIKQQKYDEALKTVDVVTQARVKTDQGLQKLIDYNTKLATQTLSDNALRFKSESTLMLVVIGIGILLSIMLGLALAAMISNSLNNLVTVADKIAEGNLNVSIDINTKDEVGILAESFKKMSNNINDAMTNINSASEQVAAGSKQISDSSIFLSEGATEQASAIEELTASIEQISAQTRLNADNASQANTLADAARVNAISGDDQMKEMLRAMEEINESSSSISKIIKVIDDIAFQTNILALNAAVEAARAGQHGKGFAVVAEEVRNLAARSANAAKETTDMIEGSIKKVDGGTKIATNTAQALNQIVEDVAKVANIVGDISIASNEQAMAIAQINQGIMQVSEVVQRNSATSEESAAASEELSSQAEILKEQVSKFKLKKTNYTFNNGAEQLSPEILKMLNDMNNNRVIENKGQLVRTDMDTKKNKTIILSDKEFGKY